MIKLSQNAAQSTSNACADGSVRLVGGDLEQEGILEICVNGLWGTVCSSGWSTIDSLVACKQMGYDFGICKHTIINFIDYSIFS